MSPNFHRTARRSRAFSLRDICASLLLLVMVFGVSGSLAAQDQPAPDPAPAPTKDPAKEPRKEPEPAPASEEPEPAPQPGPTAPEKTPEREPVKQTEREPARTEPQPRREPQRPAPEPRQRTPEPEAREPEPETEPQAGTPTPTPVAQGMADELPAFDRALLPGYNDLMQPPGSYPHLSGEDYESEPETRETTDNSGEPETAEPGDGRSWLGRIYDSIWADRTVRNGLLVVTLILVFVVYRLRTGRGRKGYL